jgi:AcrR family transcriptional regulator
VARVAKPAEFAAKRNAILDSARRLVLTKGYQRMSVQDILADLQISGGAFHHYFDSRGALLEALIDRIQHESGEPLLPIVHDPHLTAIQKLQGYLSTLDQLRIERRQDVLAALNVWYEDANAVVRQRVAEAILELRAPMLSLIVRQGVREGVFTVAFPEQAGQVVVALLQAMGDAEARMLLVAAAAADQESRINAIVAMHSAYMEAIERLLGAPPDSLERADAEVVSAWVTGIRECSA